MKIIHRICIPLALGCSNQQYLVEQQSETLTLEGPINVRYPETLYDHLKTSEYTLSFPADKTYSVNLGDCGGFYHSKGMPDQYAIDFNRLIGEEVAASRSGTVVYVEEFETDGGFPNNLVAIEHDDGTIAFYMHLTKRRALVEAGCSVTQGDIIGLSGNTGLAG